MIHLHLPPVHPQSNIRIAQKKRQIVHDDLRASVKEESAAKRLSPSKE